MTSYVLRLYDDPLLRFDASYGEGLLAGKVEAHIRWFDESKRTLLPFPLAPEPDDAKLTTWLERRTIPKNREFAAQILAQAGLNISDTLGIIDLCKGLSVNDSFWMERDDENLKFADINLYDNPLDETLASVAYTGYTSSEKHAIGLSSEWTTDGQFPRRGGIRNEDWNCGRPVPKATRTLGWNRIPSTSPRSLLASSV